MLHVVGQPRTAMLLERIGRRTTDAYWQLSAERAAYAERFFGRWNTARLDAIICPPHALPALRHGSTGDLPLAGANCYWANVLGVPAGVVAATRVRPGEEAHRPASRDTVDRAAAAVEAGSAGLPVGVQVAAKPWREDVALAVMGALESHFRSQPDYPHTPVLPVS
jgi:fatty acid amide hydrolase